MSRFTHTGLDNWHKPHEASRFDARRFGKGGKLQRRTLRAVRKAVQHECGIEFDYPYPTVLLAISGFFRSVTLGKALTVLAFALVLLFALVME